MTEKDINTIMFILEKCTYADWFKIRKAVESSYDVRKIDLEQKLQSEKIQLVVPWRDECTRDHKSPTQRLAKNNAPLPIARGAP